MLEVVIRFVHINGIDDHHNKIPSVKNTNKGQIKIKELKVGQ